MSPRTLPATSAADTIRTWIDEVFTAAAVDGSPALREELGIRLASLITLGPLSVYALDHDAKAFSRWLVEEDQAQALDRLDAAIHAVADLVAETAPQAVDRHAHVAALHALVADVLDEQFEPWVAGVLTDYS